MTMSGQTWSVVAPDGRTLGGRAFGPADGDPVLFVAGAATGSGMVFGERLLHERHLRLLTMNRPGMRASTPHPERTIASTAADYRSAVAGVLGDDQARVPVVAHSQGSVFGLALALSGAVSGLVLASPGDETAHPPIRAMLPPEATALPDLVRSAPDEAARVLSSFDPAAMESLVLSGSDDADRAVYRAPAFLARYRDALDEGFANAGAGYVRDTLLAMGEWHLPLHRMRVPVEVLIGARDAVHSPDRAETLAARIAGARRTVIDDAGGALLWTHADAVLDAVARVRAEARASSDPMH